MQVKPLIVDAHIHFYDNRANKHIFLDEFDPNYAEFVGDYSAMPRIYLPENYLQDSASYQVQGVVWHEFLSTDPIKEAKWAQHLADNSKIKQALVALVDFLDPKLEEKLDIYKSLANVSAVREHMVWDNNNPKKRFAKRPDLLTDPAWQKRLGLLKKYNFKCGLEIFAPQLSDLLKVIQLYPELNFTLAVMGWPLDLSKTGYERWKADIKKLSQCQNTCMSISAIEVIFGMNWTIDQVTPWILSSIEMFGTERCMFGSHMPIAKLSRSFDELYDAYIKIVSDFSADEKENLFYRVATNWFRI